MNNIHTIRIKADAADCNDPQDYQSHEGIKLKCNDDFNIEAAFFNRGEILDLGTTLSATLEILDVGERNSPAARTPKVLLRKSVNLEDINTDIDCEDFENGACHAVFAFTSADSAFSSGEKWLKIYLTYSDNRKTTFCNGWIDFVESFSGTNESRADIGYPAPLNYETAERLYLKKLSDLSDINNIENTRLNIGAAAAENVLAKNLNLSDLPNAATARANLGAVSNADFRSAISPLQMGNGRFYISRNYIKTKAFLLEPPFSFCITLSADFTGNVFSKGNAVLSLNSSKVLTLTDGTNTLSATLNSECEYYKIVLIIGNEHSAVYVNDAENAAINAAQFEYSDNCESLQIGGLVGAVGDIKIFNYLLNANSDAYSLQMYMRGVQENMNRYGIRVKGNSKTMPIHTPLAYFGNHPENTLAHWDRHGTLTWEGNAVTYTANAAAAGEPFSVSYRPAKTVFGNFKASMKVGTISTIPDGWRIRARYFRPDGTYANGNFIDESGAEISFSGTGGLYAIGLVIIKTSNFLAGESITISSFEITVDGALARFSDTLEGCTISDTTPNKNNAVLTGWACADKFTSPCCFCDSLVWTGGQSNGIYFGLSSDTVVLPKNTLSTVRIKSDNQTAVSFSLGGNKSAAQYGNISVSSAQWTSVQIFSDEDSPLYLTPAETLSAETKIEIAITQTKTY